MDSWRKPSRRLVRNLAFLQRAFIRRPFGRRTRWGVDTERRALAWLETLAVPSQELSFQVKVENLTLEFDLFIEEEALNEACLQLQVRAFELAPEFQSLADLQTELFSKSPISKLMSAIIRQASVDNMDAILIDLDPSPSAPDGTNQEKRIDVSFRQHEEWRSAMVIPPNLGLSIHGFTLRMQAIGYNRLRQLMWQWDRMPDQVEIDTQQSGKITFTLGERPLP